MGNHKRKKINSAKQADSSGDQVTRPLLLLPGRFAEERTLKLLVRAEQAWLCNRSVCAD